MRSVVVVFPASTWAMMPMLRISARGVVRAMAKFRRFREGREGRRPKPRSLTRRPRDVEKNQRLGGADPPPIVGSGLADAVAAALKAGRLGTHVIAAPCHGARGGTLAGVIA